MKSAHEVRLSFEELAEEVKTSGDVKAVTMRQLRDSVGAGRLAAGPLEQIRHNLDRQGLWSTDLVLEQNSSVLVYVVESPIGKIIQSVEVVHPDSDAELIRAVNSYATGDSDPRDAELQELRDLVAQVRALVGTDA